MRNSTGHRRVGAVVAIGLAAVVSGCKVGPDYSTPPTMSPPQYRETGSDAIQPNAPHAANWWAVFNDPILDNLIQSAYRQNSSLQSAAVRVLEAQARRGIAWGLLFPQQQAAFGSYTRNQLSKNQANAPSDVTRSFNEWQLGAAASWEADIWGKYRRGIESADAEVLASVANYDDVLVTLVSDVATEYLSIRILQERLAVTRANVELQRQGLEIAETRFQGGTATELDRLQATALLRDTEARAREVEAAITQAEDRLCVLLGISPQGLGEMLGVNRAIPAAPASVAIGIPADLLRRRPDIRRAERQLAAQSARIGIAKSNLYPSFGLTGDVRLVSEDFGSLFAGDSLQAFGGPTFRWDVLNYGRIENDVRVQDARFQQLIGTYESAVLQAQAEVEIAIAGYLGAQGQSVLVSDSVAAAQRAVQVAETQYRGGIADYTRVLIAQQFLQTEQDRLVSLRGAVALNLVSIYRSLGGGWELRGDRVQLDEKIQAQMRQRTNWGKLLPPPSSQAPRPATRPAT
jgi:NodT family efflux transporter outer membrane factor (OMF) lipoprotein